jgi:hemerythrin
MTRNHFSKYMASPQFQFEQRENKEHKKICERCKEGFIKFYFKKITRKAGIK